MTITATEPKTNLGRYLETASMQDIFITENGKNIARLTNPAADKLSVPDSLVGIIPQGGPRTKIPSGRSGLPDNENLN